MPRVASLFLPQLAVERLRGKERPSISRPEPRPRFEQPVDDDPGTCLVPRGGGWRPGARWATGRAVSFLAPALFGFFTFVFGADRAGIVGILLVLGAGLLALLPVKPPALHVPPTVAPSSAA